MTTPPPLPPPASAPQATPPPIPAAVPHAAPYAAPQYATVQQPPPYHPAAVPKPGFGIHWGALLGVVPFMVVRWFASAPIASANGMEDDSAMGFRLGTVLWGLVFAAAVAWGLWLLCGRRRLVANIAFVCVYGVMTLGVLARAGLALGPSQATAAAPALPVSGVVAVPGPWAIPAAEVPSVSPPTPTPAPPREAFDRATAAARAAQAQTTPPTQRWAASGAFDMSGVKSAEDLDRRVEALDALGKAMRSSRLGADAAQARLRQELAATGATGAQVELWVAQWAAESRVEHDRGVAQAVEKFLMAGRVQLKLLRQEWGRWHFDPAANRVKFQDPETQQRFRRQATEVGAAEAQLKIAVARAKSAN